MNEKFSKFFTLGKAADGKERESVEERETGLEMREREGTTGVASACAIVGENWG